MSLVKIRAALEVALDGLAGIIPSVVITSSALGVFTTASPHLLATGLLVSISGHVSTPDLNGTYFIVVTGANTFTLQHSVTKAAIASTATGVGGVLKANLTAWEGMGFSPLGGFAFQQVHMVWADTFNPSMGGSHSRESGFMQVTLYYPNQKGTFGITTRAELIRALFKRGTVFSNGGIQVNILKTPSITKGERIEENFVVAVRVFFQADIFN